VSTVADSYHAGEITSRSPALRLLVFPVLVGLAWLLEIFLFAGNNHLFARPEPAAVLLYTVTCCILTGIVIPAVFIRKAFVSGAVNMFQIGFRTFRRTFLACSFTGAIGFGIILALRPFGADRLAFANAFLLVLPTAVATVMVCWILAGTHVQAFVRRGGAVLSITTGLVVTSLLFAAAALAARLADRPDGGIFWPVIFGLFAALFFFSIRDVYSTTILVAYFYVLLGAGAFDPGILHGFSAVICGAALMALAALIILHAWRFRNYATVIVP
jgi:hypothetical protein